MVSTNSKIFLLSAALLYLTLPLSYGFLQELVLEESLDGTGNAHIIRNNVPDSSAYSLDKNIVKLCRFGIWAFYRYKNYDGFNNIFISSNGLCSNLTSFDYQSFRRVGDLDSSVDALSLFEGIGFEGQEYIVRDDPVSNINTHISSFGYTGTASWIVFELPNFGGKSKCLQAPSENKGFEHQVNIDYIGLSNIGSVIKNCPSSMLV